MNVPATPASTEHVGRHQLLLNAMLPSPRLPLFAQPDFFRLHVAEHEPAFFFQVRDERQNRIIAAAPFWCDGEVAYSPKRGSFGGFLVDVDDEPGTMTESLVEAVETRLAAAGVRTLQVTLPPQDYYPDAVAMLVEILLRRGYAIQRAALNYARDVASSESVFLERVNAGNRKNIRRATRDGHNFRRLRDDELPAAYALMVATRERRGYRLTMSLEAFETMRAAIPHSVECFAVFDATRMVAAAICVRIDARILYVVNWGEVDEAMNPSPIPFLALGINEACREAGYTLLDVGTSMVEGRPNTGLVRFKRSLGFRESLKFTLRKQL